MIWIRIPLGLGERESLELQLDWGCTLVEKVRTKLAKELSPENLSQSIGSWTKAQLRPGPVSRVSISIRKGTKPTAVLREKLHRGLTKQDCQKNCPLITCSSLLWHWALS